MFTEWPLEKVTQQLADKGWACIDASDEATWGELIGQHADVFGMNEEQTQ